MKPVIEVTDISKSYQISHQAKASYNTIKDDFEKLLRKPFGGTDGDKIETFWALKDINFQVNQGEVFGIVGKNGSGKSTLLKILSRIVDPTSGTIKIHGKVASLLEVGTGFHPELTGRENIYFNGSMIGMSKQEITRKFDEIVAFSGVEKFLDTPVKFYSSGMYVRLAFSVAAHLESEILIIDEVLSVGDDQFQKKSLAKMTSIAREGRTILFVSHSMESVKALCSRALLLDKGKISLVGETGFVAKTYLGQESTEKLEISTVEHGKDAKNKNLKGADILSVQVVDEKVLTTESQLVANIRFQIKHPTPNCFINIIVEGSTGQVVLHSRTDFVGKNPSFSPGTHSAIVEFEKPRLNPGNYSLWFRIYSKTGDTISTSDSERVAFEVKGKPTENMAALSLPSKWRWDSEA